jgi:hypothetical protein
MHAFHYQLLSGKTWGLHRRANPLPQRGGVERTAARAGGTNLPVRRQSASTVQDPLWTPPERVQSSFTSKGETTPAEGKHERDETMVVEASGVLKKRRRSGVTGRRNPVSTPVGRADIARHVAGTAPEGADDQLVRQNLTSESADRRTGAPYDAVLTYHSKRSHFP